MCDNSRTTAVVFPVLAYPFRTILYNVLWRAGSTAQPRLSIFLRIDSHLSISSQRAQISIAFVTSADGTEYPRKLFVPLFRSASVGDKSKELADVPCRICSPELLLEAEV
jgi:hypothetical protein